MTKIETRNVAVKAQWEVPAVTTLDADLSNVEAAASAGSDSLMFGANTSMS
uniref:hypothetical protein n=1 Tax=uncultured Erythrobacter sp. TaxID=263913 RepID=UPI0026245F19|nr:hypothetical protein [uncultured Erythrobacter sp.]